MLNRLIVWIKRDPQWFTKFAKKGDLFKQFEVLLADNRWEIQHQCIKFLHDAMPTFGNIRNACHPLFGSIFQKVIVGFLLNDKIEDAIIEEALREIPNLLIPEFTNQSWKTLIDGLTKIMILNPSAKRQESVACLLAHFNGSYYYKVLLNAKHFNFVDTFPEDTKSGPCMDVELRYRFGIIPVTTSNQLNSESDPLLRLSALEQVKKIINEITFEDKRKFATHLHSYFLTLGNILDDLNFKVISVCLDVLQLTLEKIGSYISPYTQQIVGLVSKHFGSQKLSLKQKIMIICMITMQYSSSKNVISHLCVYSEHRSSRIREEILNIITASLLKFDSSSINLKAIGDVVVPLTVDPKRRVRLAAFELFAVVVHCSNDSVKELLKSVTDLEQKYGNYGLLSAIKVRISRKTLPKIRRDGLIEYATPLDSDVSINKLRYSTENLDYQWIMSGSSESSNMFSRLFKPLNFKFNLILPTASVIKFPSSNLEESSIKNSEEQVKSLNGSSIKLNEVNLTFYLIQLI
ncbi:unnamed protein product [Thelazia callipaeda]|uniref:TOG domain-containing protein n=1 Tax=Thelazia callipaeda TaxID=103827 RepID=A0A0N5CZT4_THECL|nr:unnamed protein product [Thelazia callipaeda]